MRKLPVIPRKVASLVKEVRKLAGGARRVLVIGSDGAAVGAVKDTLVRGADDESAGYLLDTIVMSTDTGLPVSLNGSTGLVILVAASSELSAGSLSDRLNDVNQAGVPAVLVLSESPGVELDFPIAGIGPSRVVGMEAGGVVPAGTLTEAVVDAAGEAAVGLAAQLPALRREVCRQIIRKTSRQNAVVGALFFLPGADMPVMTLNEAKMVLNIAAAHGEKVSTERALELLGVVGAGFGLRALARQALDLLPGPGWVVKGGVAYSGTRAMGLAAQAYFDGSARVTPSRLKPLADRLIQLRG